MNDAVKAGQTDQLETEFESQWECGTPPKLTDFISSYGTQVPAQVAELAIVDLRNRWHLPTRKFAADYLHELPQLADDPQAAIELIYAEYLLWQQQPQGFDRSVFFSRYANYSSSLDAICEDRHATTDAAISPLTPPLPDFKTLSSSPTTSNLVPRLQQVRVAYRDQDKIIDGRYRLVRRLGQGGMGVVWEAEELANGRRVAIKLLSGHTVTQQTANERFLREAQLAASVTHPHTAFVFEASLVGSSPYLVMELMPGRTLRDIVVDQGPLPVHQAVDYILDAIDGLWAIHQVGIVHRDVKPSNCFLDQDGRVKVGDFGLAKLLTDAANVQDGRFVGTPAFAAPEQASGRVIDAKSDQYGIAATLYYLLTGQPPYPGSTKEMLQKVLNEPAPSLADQLPEVPRELAQIVQRAMSKDPVARFADLDKFKQALLPFSTPSSTMANLSRRMAAYAIDELLLLGAMSTVSTIIGVVMLLIYVSQGNSFSSPTIVMKELSKVQSVSAFAAAILGFVYFAVLESRLGASLGKRWLGLRVVDANGSSPSFKQSCLRAFFLPASCGLTLLDVMIPRQQFAMGDFDQMMSDPFQVMVYPMLRGIVSYIPIGICLLWIRKSNGMRGLHELASGTRVFTVRQRRHVPPQTISRTDPANNVTTESFGPFFKLRLAAESGKTRVWQAVDPVLQREVLVLEQTDAEPKWLFKQAFTVRPTRLRWLQRGTTTHSIWHAFETRNGSRLDQAYIDRQLANWDTCAQTLLQLIQELRAAEQDGTLPTELSFSHLMFPSPGHIILLDQPLRSLPTSNAATGFTGEGRGLHLVSELFRVCRGKRFWPPDAVHFEALLAQPISPGRQAIDQRLIELEAFLKRATERPVELNAIHHASVLGLIASMHGWIYTFSMIGSGYLFSGYLPGDASWRLITHLLICLLIPGIDSILLGQNLIHRIFGLQLALRNGRKASRWRSALRNIVAWFVYSFGLACFGWGLGALSLDARLAEQGGAPPADAFGLQDGYLMIFVILGGMLLAMLQLFLTCIWMIQRFRKVEDRLVGTRLFAK